MKNKSWEDMTIALDKERISSAEFSNLFADFFPSIIDAQKFGMRCLDKKRKTRWMLNRVESLVGIADHQKYDSVKVFFLLAMSEVLIKLRDNRFKDIKHQVDDVKTFFDEFSDSNKQELTKLFYKSDQYLNKKSLKFKTIVSILINVRHRLAHGKFHYDFSFNNGQENLWNPIWGEIDSGVTNKKKKVIKYELDMTYNDFRKIMIRNAISIIEKCL